jgi:hypothetical protein
MTAIEEIPEREPGSHRRFAHHIRPPQQPVPEQKLFFDFTFAIPGKGEGKCLPIIPSGIKVSDAIGREQWPTLERSIWVR